MSVCWRHEDFAARVGEQVTLRPADGHGEGVLATLAACSDAVRSDDFMSYNVTFLAGAGAPRAQSVFLVEASGCAPAPVFLVPVREAGDRLEYEAVFNQSVDNGSGP